MDIPKKLQALFPFWSLKKKDVEINKLKITQRQD